MLLIPAVASGEPVNLANQDLNALSDAGRGLMGLTDPDLVSADGTLGENDQIGADLLRDAGNPDLLSQEALDLPSGPLGIPGVMLQAYQRGADSINKMLPNCHMHWSLLASIGRIETNHARGGQVFGNGDTVRAILGPVLNGGGFAAISDTDGGVLDGDNRWDRAVGPMQFIPSTWRGYASDGNGDRVSSPHNVYDATVAAGKYLCSGGLDMANPQQRAVAVFRYNHSDSYVRTVLVWADAYAKGVTPLPSTPVPTVPTYQQTNNQADNPSPQTPPPADNGNPPDDSGIITTTPTTPPPVCPTPTETSTPTETPTSTPTTTPTPTTPPPGCETTTPTSPPSSGGGDGTTTPPTTTTNSPSGGGESSTGGETTTTTTQQQTSAADTSSSTTLAEETTTSPLGP
ncbi:lytic transglycosylase domain-containing protein [Actinophytocola sp.]|uniref:lytic transglycosylase domain-containing protein n=1 Tax=Actinophytocola sp. TaxID=1872138 RepID=UPI002D7E605D|nr:lytic murein transglycosylase [Actinophytocola sp.]